MSQHATKKQAHPLFKEDELFYNVSENQKSGFVTECLKERDDVMEVVLETLSKYKDIGITGVLLVQMIMLLVCIFMVRRLSRYVRKIHKAVQDYINVIMEEEVETEQQIEPQRVMSGQELQMMETISQRKRQQEEEVFNAVLQEIFP